MFKYFLRNITCLLFTVFLLLSCGNQAEPPRQAKVFSKKIVIKTEKTIKKPVVLSTPKPDKAGREIALKPEPAAAKTMLYNPEGKIDPFTALFKEEKLAAVDGEAMEMGKAGICILRTPLQNAGLSQLKLTGIILSSRDNRAHRAMVEEASGRGYVIEKGTFIGTNCGRVARILKDRIIVNEPLLPVDDVDKDSIYDVDGKSFFITEIDGKRFINIDGKEFKAEINKIKGTAYYIDPQELKLQKPSGE